MTTSGRTVSTILERFTIPIWYGEIDDITNAVIAYRRASNLVATGDLRSVKFY